MKKLYVIHPKDRSTEVLSILYRECEVVNIITDPDAFSNEVSHFLNHISKDSHLMLLGHGSPDGLYSRFDDSGEPVSFDKVLVNHSHAYHLRKHNHQIIGIFCYAREFAEKERLHGLFSGMFISEYKEALELGIETSEEEIRFENEKFFKRLRQLLDDDVPLFEIPDRMRELDDVKSPLTNYNYYSIYYI